MLDGAASLGTAGLGDRANLLYSDGMRLSFRDASLLEFLDHVGQLDSNQIWQLLFAECKSKTSWNQVSKRLVRDKFIMYMGQRPVEKTLRGSGPAVYQLGPTGWQFLGKGGVFRPRFTSIDKHCLKIGDVFAQFREQEDLGNLKILGYSTEPNSHNKIAGVTLRTDLYVEVMLTGSDEPLHIMIEVDRNTENKTQIQRKVADYITMLDWATKDEIEREPHVVFLTESDIGVSNLNRYMYGKLRGKRIFPGKTEPRDWSHLITVGLVEGFAARLSSTA